MSATRRAEFKVRLPVDLYVELRSTAAEREVSVNHLVSRAVAAYLSALIPVEDL